MKLFFQILVILLLPAMAGAQFASNRQLFTNNWKFQLGAVQEAPSNNYNDKDWRSLNLPHDWSIEFPFDSTSPTGTGGGALRGGLGWYRKTFTLPEADKGKKVFIDFDGVYMNSEVFINGHSLGVRPNGYISFRYDLTPHLKFNGAKNVLAVKVDNSQQPNSRWYSGSGIYRNVWLTVANPIHVAHWGTFVTTPKVTKEKAAIAIETLIDNESKQDAVITLHTIIYNAGKKEVARQQSEHKLPAEARWRFTGDLIVANPQLWFVANPNMYKVVTEIWKGGQKLDSYETPLGIRYFNFDAKKGFSLNGENLKIRGVCMHHDLGALGTAINTDALKRQLRILKEMGVNGIRTSHNPPAPELLQLCDEMGFIVMNEMFDMWKQSKSPYDYHLYWDAWHKKDLQDFVTRDRNHPSIFMWSVGNEIKEQWGSATDSSGIAIAKSLYGITKKLDPTRPVVNANNETGKHNNLLKSGAFDIIGYNYHHQQWDSAQHRWGQYPFIATESTSALQTRGQYDMPSDSIRRWPYAWDKPFYEGNADFTCSAYDNVSAPWGSTHEESLKILEKYPHVSGMYIWTGFDYIGEPTPYPWPARSSYFGIVDLTGFPKDVYYLYQSVWTNQPMLHVFPHWNWQQGKTVDVWAYYNHADEVELFLNNQSLGVKRKADGEYHISWPVKYTPGVLKAVSRKNGVVVLTKEIKTAGKPAAIVLEADTKRITANGRDMSFVTAKVVDENGVVVPDADHQIQLSITGGGFIAGVDNGSQTSMESFKASQRKVMNGLCLAMLQSNGKKANIQLQATASGLKPTTIIIHVN